MSLERLERRQLMATTATLSTERLAVSVPVTFRGDAATPISWQTTRAGQFTWTNASGDAREAGLPASFTTFCIDGLQGVVPGRATTFTEFSTALNANPFGGTTSAMGVDRANLLTQFWNQFGPADNVAGFSNATDAAAFQLAVWEIVYDATPAGNGMSFSLTAGKFQVGPTAQAAPAVVKAGQMMQAFDTTLVGEIQVYVNAMESPTSQGQAGGHEKPPGEDTGDCDGVPPETCSSATIDQAIGQLTYSTIAGSGGGAGSTPSIGMQRRQPMTTAPLFAPTPAAPFGNGWSRTAAPTLTMRGPDPANPTSVSIVFNSSDTRVYQNTSTSPGQPAFSRATRQGSTDRFALEGGSYVFRTAAGDTLTFNGFGASIPAAARGQLVSRSDSSGNRFDYTFNADGSVARLTSSVAGQATPVEIQDYVYLPGSDPNTGKVARIDIRRGDSTLVRTTTFTYHDGTTAFGTLGDLAGMQVRDASGALLDSSVYRYTTASSGQSLIEYSFDTDAVRRATAAGLNLATATNSAVAPFATDFFAYDAQNRVIRHDVQGAGCSSCTGGIGTFTYAYAQNPKPVIGSNLDWRTKSTETRPDGTERIVYSNARTQPMLEVIRTTEGGVTKQQGTYTRYNARGQAIWQVSPEAINLPANLAEIEQYPDLLNEVAGNFQYISDSSGLIEVTNYATATTATATTAGSVDRFVSSTAVMRGDRGTAVTSEPHKDRHNP